MPCDRTQQLAPRPPDLPIAPAELTAWGRAAAGDTKWLCGCMPVQGMSELCNQALYVSQGRHSWPSAMKVWRPGRACTVASMLASPVGECRARELTVLNHLLSCPMQTDDDVFLRLGPTLDFVRSLPPGYVLAGCVILEGREKAIVKLIAASVCAASIWPWNPRDDTMRRYAKQTQRRPCARQHPALTLPHIGDFEHPKMRKEVQHSCRCSSCKPVAWLLLCQRLCHAIGS